MNPNVARYWMIQGMVLLRLQRYTEALAAADRCFALGPDTMEGFTRASAESLRDSGVRG